jgi:putative inorganic carbon (HCO3(-)) transporter
MNAVALDWWRPERKPERGAAQTRVPVETVPEASSLAYGAFTGFTCVLLLAPQNLFPFLGKLRLALLMGAVAIVAHIQNRWALGLPATKPSRQMGVALALLIWTVCGMPFSLWPGGSLSLLLDLYLKALAVFWLIANVVDTVDRLRGLAWTLTGITVALSLVGIYNYASGVFGQTLDRRIVGYDAGLTRNPNDLALMINLIMPLAVALLLSSAGPLARVALGLAIVIQVIAVVLTFSRSGFLTLAVNLGLYGLRLVRRPSRGLVLAGLLAVPFAIPFIPQAYVDRLLTLGAINSDPTGSSQARWQGTVAAVEHAVENPLMGAGLGMNILVLNESVGATWRVVHNTYLEYAVDLGLPGLLLFLLLLFGSLKSVRAVRRQGGGPLATMSEGIEISLLGFAVAAFFCPVAYAFYFFYIAGLATAAHAIFRPGASGPAKGTP